MTEKEDEKTEVPSPPKPRSRPASPGFDFTTPPNVPSELPDDDPSTPPQKRPEAPVPPPAPTTLRRSTRQVRPVIPYIAGTSGLDEFQAQLESVYTDTGGEGTWKPVVTCWVHLELMCIFPTM